MTPGTLPAAAWLSPESGEDHAAEPEAGRRAPARSGPTPASTRPSCPEAPADTASAQGSRRPWTSAEDDALRLAYTTGGPTAARQALPHRSLPSLHKRACKLRCTRIPHWTPEEDSRLRLLWGDGHTVNYVARKLGRPPFGVYERARTIGLPCGCPQGHEYMTHAARRTGYTIPALRHILRWAGVPIRPAMSLPTPRPKRGRVVDSGDLDDALDRWIQTEPVESAACRIGACGETVKRRLAVIGIAMPGGRRHLRVTADQVNHALALEVVGGRLQPGANP